VEVVFSLIYPPQRFPPNLPAARRGGQANPEPEHPELQQS